MKLTQVTNKSQVKPGDRVLVCGDHCRGLGHVFGVTNGDMPWGLSPIRPFPDGYVPDDIFIAMDKENHFTTIGLNPPDLALGKLFLVEGA